MLNILKFAKLGILYNVYKIVCDNMHKCGYIIANYVEVCKVCKFASVQKLQSLAKLLQSIQMYVNICTVCIFKLLI